MRPTYAAAALALGLVASVAGCGGSSPRAIAPASSPTSRGVQDLAVTDAIRAQLVAAGAKAKGLTATDFTGLVKGFTYYAYDPATHTYWAGAALKPSPSSMPAQVSTQDDGSYTLFHRSATGSWIAMDSALAGPNGPADSKPCSVTPPAGVLTIWGWPANSCHPTGA